MLPEIYLREWGGVRDDIGAVYGLVEVLNVALVASREVYRAILHTQPFESRTRSVQQCMAIKLVWAAVESAAKCAYALSWWEIASSYC